MATFVFFAYGMSLLNDRFLERSYVWVVVVVDGDGSGLVPVE